MGIPPFEPSGLLPVGIHCAEWAELAARFGSTPYRRRILQGLLAALQALQSAGCLTAYIDGSFVTAKEFPADFDGCWDLTGVDASKLDPVLLDFDNGRAAQKARYMGEFFPAQLPNGISRRTFLEFFQIDKQSGSPKGIIVIDLGSL